MVSPERKQAVEILKNRYSCRQFNDVPLEVDVLNEIIEVGLNAASGGNLQPVSIVMVRDTERKQKIKELCRQGFIGDADTLFIFLLDYYRLQRWAEVEKAPFGRHNSFTDFIIAVEDVMCVAQSMECAATLLGVGTVYIGTVNYYYEQLQELLDLPAMTIPILMSCIGYPKDAGNESHLQGHLRKKFGRDVIVHEEKYCQMSDDDVRDKIVAEKYQNWLQELKGDVLDKYKQELFEVAKAVNGEEYAKEVVERINEQQGINRAQFRLGHHYNPVRLRAHNKRLFEFYQSQGFNFWKE